MWYKPLYTSFYKQIYILSNSDRVAYLASTELLIWPVLSSLFGRYRVAYLASTELLIWPVPSLLFGQYRVAYLASTKLLIWPVPRELKHGCYKT